MMNSNWARYWTFSWPSSPSAVLTCVAWTRGQIEKISGNKVKQQVTVKTGVESELAKKIIRTDQRQQAQGAGEHTGRGGAYFRRQARYSAGGDTVGEEIYYRISAPVSEFPGLTGAVLSGVIFSRPDLRSTFRTSDRATIIQCCLLALPGPSDCLWRLHRLAHTGRNFLGTCFAPCFYHFFSHFDMALQAQVPSSANA